LKINRAELQMLQIAVRFYARHLANEGEHQTPQAKHLAFAYAHLKGYEHSLDNLANYPVGSAEHAAAKLATS